MPLGFFSSDEQIHLIYCGLCLCLQTHRELDGPPDSERRRYGAVHRTAETVSVNGDICRGSEGRQVIDTFSPTVLQARIMAAEPVSLLISVSHGAARLLAAHLPEMRAVIQLGAQVAPAMASRPAIEDLVSRSSVNVTQSQLILRGGD